MKHVGLAITLTTMLGILANVFGLYYLPKRKKIWAVIPRNLEKRLKF